MPKKKKRKISFKKVFILLLKLVLILAVVFTVISWTWNHFTGGEKFTDYQTEINAEYDSISAYQTEERATVVVEKFVTDYYTLQYKESRSDIGGTDLIYSEPEFYDGFISESKQTYYNDIDVLIDTYGSKKLPAVTNVETTSSQEYVDVCYDAYPDCFESVYVFDVAITYSDTDATNELNPPAQVYVGVGWHNGDYQIIFLSNDEEI